MKAKNYKPVITEKEEQVVCLALLRRIGFVVFRHNTGGMYQYNKDGSRRYTLFNEKGYPDIAGYSRTGQAVYWEVKRKGKKPSTEQKAFIERARASHCIAGIGSSDDLMEYLRCGGYVK